MASKKQIFLPGLNGVRFIAAFLVILDHTELFKSYMGLRSWWSEDYSSFLGNFGVTIFFTLSGFLITYLLREEINLTGRNISLRNFYMRRILRIWPLYYLILILSFFVLPHLGILKLSVWGDGLFSQGQFSERLLLFTFLLPNIAFVFYPIVPFGNVLWSVGVEEQFYLFWPVLIKKIRKTIFSIALGCLAIYMAAKFMILFTSTEAGGGKAFLLIDKTRFSCMLIGAIASGLTNLDWLKSKWVQWTSLLLFCLMMLNLINFRYYGLIRNEAHAVVIALLLINISLNSKTIFRLENPLLDYLGKISYGLYVYHSIMAVLVLNLMVPYYQSISFTSWSILVIAFVLILTIVVSHLSYFFFEKKLLNKKAKYSTVISGDQVSQDKPDTLTAVPENKIGT